MHLFHDDIHVLKCYQTCIFLVEVNTIYRSCSVDLQGTSLLSELTKKTESKKAKIILMNVKTDIF